MTVKTLPPVTNVNPAATEGAIRTTRGTRPSQQPLKAAVLVALGAATAVAQAQQPGPRLEEVVVTAQKRGVVENAQDVPIAVYGFSGAMLDEAQVSDMADLGRLVPAADLPPVSPIRGYANFNIRGMGTIGTVVTEDPTVGIVIDGIPLGIAAGGVLDIYDLESAEVLAGPQGTLFGRNTTGGAVVLRTRRPSGEAGARLDAGLGNFGHVEVGAALENANASGTLAGRLAVRYQQNDDIFDNVAGPDVGEREFYMIRPSVRWQPNDSLTFDLIAEIGKDEGDGPAARNIFDPRTVTSQRGFVPPANKFDLALNNPNTSDLEWSHLIAEINWDLAGGVLTSVTGYREMEQVNEVDSDGSALSIFNFNPFIDQNQFSQELRWSGMVGDSLNLTTGVYFFSQELDYKERRVILGGVQRPALRSKQDHEQWALFAEGTYEFSSVVSLVAGLRYTEETKDIQVASFGNCSFDFTVCTFDQDLGETWSSLTPKLGLNFRLADDWLVWGSWTRGFRSGGFNGRNPNPQTPAGPFDEETVDAFEIGSKLTFLDGAARLNLAIYYNDFEDLQRTILNANNLQTVENAAAATISGAEIDFAWSATERLTLSAGFAYVDADYKEFTGLDVDFPADGIPDPDRAKNLDFYNVAKYSASGSISYDGIDVGAAGTMSLRASAYWKDKFPANVINTIIYDSIFVADASATLHLPGDKMKLTLYGKNLTDEQYGQGAASTGLFFVDFIATPRTYGVKVSYEF